MLGRLKDIADNHPFFVAIGIFTAGVGVGAIPVTIAQSSQDAEVRSLQAEADSLRTEKAELEREIGAVTRIVDGEEVAELRADQLVVSAADAQDLSRSLDYIEVDDLYAPPVDAERGWSYTATDESGLVQMQVGVGGAEIEDSPLGEVAKQRVHLWHSVDVHTVSYEGGQLSVFPFVAVERLSATKLPKQMAAVAGSHDLDNYIRDDAVGALFGLNVVNLVAQSSPQVSVLLTDVQRAEDVIYCDATIVFHDVTVDDRDVSRYYLRREMLFMRAGEDVVLVITNLPSADRRSDEASTVTRILTGLHIVA